MKRRRCLLIGDFGEGTAVSAATMIVGTNSLRYLFLAGNFLIVTMIRADARN